MILRGANCLGVGVADVAGVFVLIGESFGFAEDVERPANSGLFFHELVVGEHSHVAGRRHADAGVRRPLLVVIPLLFQSNRNA